MVKDEPPSRGPMSGLAAGLNRMQSSHLLALAVDLPNVTTEHLRKLRALTHQCRGLIPMNGSHFEPLCAIYPLEAAAIANDLLVHGKLSLQDLAQRLLQQNLAEAYSLNEIECPLYRNANTPSDLDR